MAFWTTPNSVSSLKRKAYQALFSSTGRLCYAALRAWFV